MPLNALSVNFSGVGAVELKDIALPEGSVLRALKGTEDIPAAPAGATHLRLDPAQGQLQAWLQRTRGARAAIEVAAGGTACAVDIMPHKEPALRRDGWVTVLGTTVGMLHANAQEAVPHVALSVLKEQFAKSEVGGKRATAISALIEALKGFTRPVSDDPAKAIASYQERLTSVWDAWQTIADHAADVAGDAAPTLRNAVDSVPTLVARTDPHLPAESVLSQLRNLSSLHIALLSTRWQAAAESCSELPAPDYDALAQDITHEILSFYLVARRKTANDDVLGALLEERLRSLLRRWLGGLSLSTGTLTGLPGDFQIDGIIWDPTVRPALVEEGGVVVVDPLSVRGIVEIKASVTSLEDFARRLFDMGGQVAGYYDRVAPGASYPPILGFVVWDKGDHDTIRLRSRGLITSLSRKLRPDEFEPDPRAVADLLRFVYAFIHGRQ